VSIQETALLFGVARRRNTRSPVQSLIAPENLWPILAVILAGVALCIYLEQNFRWAARMSGPVLAIVGAMVLSNLKVMPGNSSAYDLVEDYLVPAAIPLLLFRANILRILRQSGSMFLCFNIAAVGSVLGAFLAAFLFKGSFPRVAEVAGIMTASYVGGSVNFVAVRNHYEVASELANPLVVADNFIMAAMFGVLFLIANSRFFRRHYAHPHSVASDAGETQALAAEHWQPKGIALFDIAKALAIAFAITAVSVKAAAWLKQQHLPLLFDALFANRYLLITIFTVALTTTFGGRFERMPGAEELGMYFLYLFFFVIGLRADLMEVIRNVPVLFSFCTVIAVVNLGFTLGAGKLLRLNLEELLLASNGTLGGPPSAVAMSIAAGWPKLILPGLLAAIWGYVIGTFVGIAVAEALKRML
jgi:uncharacterized membrane protein